MKLRLLAAALVATLPHAAGAAESSRFAVTLGNAWQSLETASPVSHADVVIPCQGRGCGEIESDRDDSGLALGLSWYVTPAFAVEFWGSQGGDARAEIDLEYAPDVGLSTYRAKPMMVTAQYHFRLPGRFTPFVGLGWQKTSVSDVSINTAIINSDGVRVGDADGAAAVVGVDVALGGRWFVRGDVRYLDGDSRVKTASGGASSMDMGLTAYGLSAGIRF